MHVNTTLVCTKGNLSGFPWIDNTIIGIRFITQWCFSLHENYIIFNSSFCVRIFQSFPCTPKRWKNSANSTAKSLPSSRSTTQPSATCGSSWGLKRRAARRSKWILRTKPSFRRSDTESRRKYKQDIQNFL